MPSPAQAAEMAKMNSPIALSSKGRLDFLFAYLRCRLYAALTKRASPIFLKPADRISESPAVEGIYEWEVVALIRRLARAGGGDALFDIGANIGLTSFYVKGSFKNVYCFEPNPKIFHILSANLFESLGRGVALFNFGLGPRDEENTLNIPKDNAGGAFVLGEANGYSLEEIAAKDGFAKFDPQNYDQLPIKLRKGREVLGPLFSGSINGAVIKIDVEGFEAVVLEEIFASLPKALPVGIVFENWSKDLAPAEILRAAGRPDLVAYRLGSTLERAPGKLGKLAALLLKGQAFSLEAAPRSWIGTVLLTNLKI